MLLLHAVTSGPDNMQTTNMQVVPESCFLIRPLFATAEGGSPVSATNFTCEMANGKSVVAGVLPFALRPFRYEVYGVFGSVGEREQEPNHEPNPEP